MLCSVNTYRECKAYLRGREMGNESGKGTARLDGCFVKSTICKGGGDS